MPNVGFSIPGVDLAAGTLTLPIWVGGVISGVLLLLLLLVIFRGGFGTALGSIVPIAALVLALVGGWLYLDRSAARDRADERRALDQRIAVLNAGALASGSALACLDAGIADSIESACEKAVFASPESVAAAIVYVGARLSLLAEGFSFAARADAGYETSLAGLRRAAEADRFGFVAQVLATRDGCTAEKCPLFAWLNDAERVRANLNDHTFEGLIARNSANWSQQGRAPAPVAAAPSPPPNAATSMTFPSAASIPPVSIMNGEPAAGSTGTAAAAPAAAPSPSPARRPVAPRPLTPRQAGATAAAPVQISPPPPTAGAQPRAQ
jgi:hypothetical protein